MAYRVHTYSDFMRWIAQPTVKPGHLDGPGNSKVKSPMDLMFIHKDRWERINQRSYRNTQEEKARLNSFMDKFVEVGEMVKNRALIRTMLERVHYEIPKRPMEARRIQNYKQFLANSLLIIEAAYGKS